MGYTTDKIQSWWHTATINFAQYVPLFRALLLLGIMAVAFGARLFSVLRYESVIHEFDPWFNYRATLHLVNKGWYAFTNWFDTMAWYPLGRHVGPTVFPGMMVTSSVIHWVLNKLLAWPVEVREVCVFLAPVAAGFTCLLTYGLAKELQGPGAGLIAATFMAVCPGYISRSVAGSYDYEAIAICQMLLAFYAWMKAIRTHSAGWAAFTALAYFYMASTWGGYVYVINLIPLHVAILLAMGRYSRGLYKVYSWFFVLGQSAVITIKFVGVAPILQSEHLPARLIFPLLQVWAIAEEIKRLVGNTTQFRALLKMALVGGILFLGTAVVGLTILGVNVLGPWAGRLYALIDSEYSRMHRPIIASVSEHQPTPWGSYFFDLNLLLILAPVGLYFVLYPTTENRDRLRRKLTRGWSWLKGGWEQCDNQHLFAALYTMTAVYFSSVMVRLMLVLAPIMCILGGIAVSKLFHQYCNQNLSENEASSTPKNASIHALTISLCTTLSLIYYGWHCLWVTSASYSSPSIMLATTDPRTGQSRIIDDFREGFYWLRRNTPSSSRILSWWDYGYQITGMANRTTIVDNNTCNNDHIALVGLTMGSSEEQSYPLLRKLRADYVLVWAGVLSGFQGDDINKFLWMVRIAAGVYPNRISERDYLTAQGEYRVDEPAVASALKNSLLYKMVYYGTAKTLGPTGIDRARNVPLRGVDPKLSILEEAYTTDNHMVRIYRVKQPDVLGRSLFKVKSL